MLPQNWEGLSSWLGGTWEWDYLTSPDLTFTLGRRGGGGGRFWNYSSKIKFKSKCGPGQGLRGHTLLSPLASCLAWTSVPQNQARWSSQNHVHERDKGNHLLHWRPWLDVNTNLGRVGGGGGGEGKERESRRRWESVREWCQSDLPFSLIFLISSVGFSANRMNVIIIQKQKDSDSKVTVQWLGKAYNTLVMSANPSKAHFATLRSCLKLSLSSSVFDHAYTLYMHLSMYKAYSAHMHLTHMYT